jgi:ribonuclease HI
VYPDDPTEHQLLFQGFRESTINRMEISACIAATEWMKRAGIGRQYSRVQTFCDSQYVVNGQVLGSVLAKSQMAHCCRTTN